MSAMQIFVKTLTGGEKVTVTVLARQDHHAGRGGAVGAAGRERQASDTIDNVKAKIQDAQRESIRKYHLLDHFRYL